MAMITIATMLLAVSAARAGACEAPVSADTLSAELIGAESALKSGDPTAAQSADRLIAEIGCLSDTLPAEVFARVYRAIGAGRLAGGDEAGARLWFSSAIAANRTFAYGTEDLPADHPALSVYADVAAAGLADPVRDTTHTLAPGAWTLDGRKLIAVTALPDAPHVLQRVDDRGVHTWRIDGATFPVEALGAAAASVSSIEKPLCPSVRPGKRYYGGQVDSNGDGKCDMTLPPRPLEKTPLILAGTFLMGGAGGLYAYAAESRDQFVTSGAVGDVIRYKTLTNHLVVASGATLAVGMLSLGCGVFISDEGTVIPRVSGRF